MLLLVHCVDQDVQEGRNQIHSYIDSQEPVPACGNWEEAACKRYDGKLVSAGQHKYELQNKRGLTMQIADRIRGMVMDNIIEVKGESIRGAE
jgi:hypothetical protein